jgi:hypothetical protein
MSNPEDEPEMDLTPEQQAAYDQGVLVIRQIAEAILPFAPEMTEAQLSGLAIGALEEQQKVMHEIFPTLFGEQAHHYPSIQVLIKGPNGMEGAVTAPKRLEGVEDPQPGLQWAFMQALLLSPSVRAILRVWGFTYSFAQVQADVSKPTGIIVKH